MLIYIVHIVLCCCIELIDYNPNYKYKSMIHASAGEVAQPWKEPQSTTPAPVASLIITIFVFFYCCEGRKV